MDRHQSRRCSGVFELQAGADLGYRLFVEASALDVFTDALTPLAGLRCSRSLGI
ncbi:hypothetical protein P7F88_25355 [Vibrio hannami]|uniref:hypothetical protein n=1 Tax=Vibrio hannami TaxID=2717094 RepID=UPI00240EC97E|nr:hypothetical protein [Vibrio hannami]MDG3089193.1 hypothetical protein [Vibrio hannami]